MTEDKKNLPATRRNGGSRKGSSFLAKVRSAKVAKPPRGSSMGRVDPSLVAAALAPRATRPRLVFAVDATASREPAWEAARATTDALFAAAPGELDVALAAHGGSRIKLFTKFTANAASLRDQAAALRCEGGTTQLIELMDRCRTATNVKVLVYIGDVFEEDIASAEQMATSLRLRGTRVVILHDRTQPIPDDTEPSDLEDDLAAFNLIATLTKGAVLPFDSSAVTQLRDLLAAIATLAVGGVKLLTARASQLPAANLLLAQLPSEE